MILNGIKYEQVEFKNSIIFNACGSYTLLLFTICLVMIIPFILNIKEEKKKRNCYKEFKS